MKSIMLLSLLSFILSDIALPTLTLASDPKFAAPIGEVSENLIPIEFVKPILKPVTPPIGKWEELKASLKHRGQSIEMLSPWVRNKIADQLNAGYDKIEPANVLGNPGNLLIAVPRHQWTEQMQKAYDFLQNDPIFRESMKFKTIGRNIHKSIHGTENGFVYGNVDSATSPLYLMYLENEEEIWGLGPQMTDGRFYAIKDGPNHISYTNNLIVMESGSQMGIKALDNDSFLKHGYLSLVMAHENAHAIMQEAYGVREFTAMTNRSHSGIGHDVNYISNRRLAMIEGWAIAFEAYLSEKYSAQIDRNKKDMINNGLQSFLKQLYGMARLDRLRLIYSLIRAGELPGLFVNHLLTTRGNPVRTNAYTNPEEPMDFITLIPKIINRIHKGSWESFDRATPQQNLAKEGVIAYEFYRLLKGGRYSKIIEVFSKSKPTDYSEFYLAYIKANPQDRDFISEGFFESFHPEALKIQPYIISLRQKAISQATFSWMKRDEYIVSQYRCINPKQYSVAYKNEFPEDSTGYQEALTPFSIRNRHLMKLINDESKSHIKMDFSDGPFSIQDYNSEIIPLKTAREKLDQYIYLTRKSWVKTASILHKEQNKLHLRYQEKVKATGYPVPVDFGPEIWLEFKQRGLMQRIFMGYEGRIDLNSATRLQIQNFIYSSSYHENSWFSINFLKTHIAPSFPGTRAAERDGILNQAMEIRDSAPRGHLRSLGELRDLPGNWFSKVFIESYRPELK